MPTWIGLAQGGPQAPFYANLIVPFALILGIWWFLLIRPQGLFGDKIIERI